MPRSNMRNACQEVSVVDEAFVVVMLVWPRSGMNVGGALGSHVGAAPDDRGGMGSRS